MKQVSKSEFYEYINPLDAVVSVVGTYPYVTFFKTRSGHLLGEVKDFATQEEKQSEYFLKNVGANENQA